MASMSFPLSSDPTRRMASTRIWQPPYPAAE
jgi:hypothetical protein